MTEISTSIAIVSTKRCLMPVCVCVCVYVRACVRVCVFGAVAIIITSLNLLFQEIKDIKK